MKGTDKVQEQSMTGEWGSTGYAPIQIGATTPMQALSDKQYNALVSGMFNYLKAYVKKSAETFQPAELAKEYKKGTEAYKQYEEKISGIADTLMTSFAQTIQPDELKTFPLDSFLETSVKDIYQKASDIYTSPTLNRNEIKTMVDANIGTIAGQFREQRRNIQQQLSARGIDPNSAAGQAELNRIERDVTSAKEGTARTILANEIGSKYDRQLAALGQMTGAAQLGETVVSDQAQRWLNQYAQKLDASRLQIAGLTTAMQGYQGAAGLAGQQLGAQWQMMNYPLNVVSENVLPYLQTIGSQDIAAHSGASTSWGSQQSSGTTWNTSNPWLNLAGSGLQAGGYALGSYLGS